MGLKLVMTICDWKTREAIFLKILNKPTISSILIIDNLEIQLNQSF
ncbi:MAG: hypothetical protein ACJAUQ_001809 [Maribacter sp.]|jgi:hypothetical protein